MVVRCEEAFTKPNQPRGLRRGRLEKDRRRKKDLFVVGRMNVSPTKPEERILKLRRKECSV